MSRKGKKKTPIKKDNTLDIELIIPDDSPGTVTQGISTENELNDSCDSVIKHIRGISKDRESDSVSVSGSAMSVTEEGDVHVIEHMETEPPFPLRTERKVGMMETDPPFPLRTEERVGIKEGNDDNEVSEITYVTESSPEPAGFGAESSVVGVESTTVEAESSVVWAESSGTPVSEERDEIVVGSSQEECSVVSSPSGSLVGERK